jgi:DNA polymerase-1
LAVAWDTDQPTERHQAFPQYKAQRDALPEDIEIQLPLVQRLMDALRVNTLEFNGFEADDIIGTLAHRAEAEGFDVWMVTPDKDYDQLVTEHVRVLKPGRQGSQFEVLGVPQVLEKWHVERVAQVIDILGLMGDTSDNIPGVPGIGEKTAQKLIAEYGSIEALLANTAKLKGAQRTKLEENRDRRCFRKNWSRSTPMCRSRSRWKRSPRNPPMKTRSSSCLWSSSSKRWASECSVLRFPRQRLARP